MTQLFCGDGGYACDMALCNDSWRLAYISIADVDRMFVEDVGRYETKLKPGTSVADWMKSLSATPRELHFVSQTKGQLHESILLAQAERLDGPAVVGGETAAVVWTQRDGDGWSLMAYNSGKFQTMFESSNPLRNPAACRDADGQLWCACDFRESGQDMIRIQTSGKEKHGIVIQGRRPRMASGKDGAVWVSFERAENGFAHVYLQEMSKTSAVKLSSGDTLNFTAHPLVDEDGQVLVIWENCPGWGQDEQLGRFRQIMLKTFDPGSGNIQDGPGTEDGVIPIPVSAFHDLSVQNLIPINPLLLNTTAGLTCTYRMFRFSGHKSFGWDIFELHSEGENWSAPRQMTEQFGFSGTPYGVCSIDGSLLVAAHCCEHLPRGTFAKQQQEATMRNTQHTWSHRVELLKVSMDEKVKEKRLEYEPLEVVVPESVGVPSQEPGTLLNSPAGLQLIWGDLHAHSCLSKCMSDSDGMPADILRWQRDIVGCRVLCLTEHVEFLSSVEFLRALDLVEAEAVENDMIPLYGVEWAKYPAHHTNFFCVDRQIFEQLRALLLNLDHLSAVYERVKKEFPPRSVIAIRHFHGMTEGPHNVLSDDVAATHDPEIERAMEVAQIRGDMMFSPPKKSLPAFPSKFLLSGAKIGLMAGSDHARAGTLRFCLTGFWVPEVTPQAVFDALWNRQTIGSISGKMAVWLRGPGVEMGEEGNADLPIRLSAELASAYPLRNVRLWRDGKWLAPENLSSEAESVMLEDKDAAPGEHCYVIRAETEPTINKLPVVGYSSPVWLRVQ